MNSLVSTVQSYALFNSVFLRGHFGQNRPNKQSIKQTKKYGDDMEGISDGQSVHDTTDLHA